MTDELDAMRALRTAIEPLDDEQRIRAAKWLMAFVSDEASGSDSGRPMSEKWRAVLTAMVDAGGSGNYDDMARWATAAGHRVSRAAARAQTHNYIKTGLLTHGDDGAFVITPAGRAAAGCD